MDDVTTFEDIVATVKDQQTYGPIEVEISEDGFLCLWQRSFPGAEPNLLKDWPITPAPPDKTTEETR